MFSPVATWVRVSAMHIARAYCVEADRVVDIYKARALFFAHDEPRRRFRFLCSDYACRATNVVRVIGVNHDKLVEDERAIAFFFNPRFRMNPETSRGAECEGVARERILDELDSWNAVPEQGGRAHGFRHPKSSDFVDVFQTRSD